MMRRSLLWLITILLVAASLPAGAQGPGDGGPPDDAGDAGADGRPEGAGPAFDPQERAQAAGRDWQNLSMQQRELAGQRAEQARLFALFTIDEAGAVTGRFVNFTLETDAAAVTDYQVGFRNESTLFFDRVAIEPWTNASDPLLSGAVLRVASDEALLAVHNNPTGQLRVVSAAENVTVTFALPEGATVASAEERAIRINADGRHGHIVLAGEGELVNGTGAITATLGTNASVVFLAHPDVDTVHAADLHAQVDSIAQGRFGGEINVVAVDSQPVATASEYDVSLRASEVAQNRVVVTAESEADTGRAVVVNVPTDLVGNATQEQIQVLLDGEPISRGNMLLQSPVGTEAQYQVTVVEGAAQVVVAIPSWSTHEITVTTAEETPTDGEEPTNGEVPTDGEQPADGADTTEPPADEDTPAPGLLLVLALVGAAALVSRRRRV